MKRMLSGAAGLALIVFTIGFVASAAKADTITRPVGDAGSVTFTTEGGVLALVGAEAAEGWTYSVDRQDGSHLKVTFRDGSGAELEFEAEIEGGRLVFGTTEEPGSPTTTVPGDGSPTTTLGDAGRAGDDRSTTSTTLDDRSDDDDSDDDDADDDDADDSSGSDDDDADDDDADDSSGSDDDDADDDDADDSSGSDDDDADDDDRSSSGPGDASVTAEPATYVVASAGTVSVLFADGEVSLAGVTITDGWAYEVDHIGGSHVEIEFHGPDGAGFEFRVDADGSVEID